MDGKRVREYFSAEVDSLLATFTQFEVLIPHATNAGSAHAGEDGRYVESLIVSFLKKFLPKELEVLTGFVLRPAVKTGKNGKTRKGEQDRHSSQIDILVYDSSKHPVYQRFDRNVIVPPEGVVAAFSVKKNLRDADIVNECSALKVLSELCICFDQNGLRIRRPYLGLISMTSLINKKSPETKDWIFSKLQEVYGSNSGFEDLIGYIGSFKDWSIFKRRPSKSKSESAEYVLIEHNEQEEHMALQFLLTGILSVYYDASRSACPRPGFTAFESGRTHSRSLGEITLDLKK